MEKKLETTVAYWGNLNVAPKPQTLKPYNPRPSSLNPKPQAVKPPHVEP